jgi:hypothetical protein
MSEVTPTGLVEKHAFQSTSEYRKGATSSVRRALGQQTREVRASKQVTDKSKYAQVAQLVEHVTEISVVDLGAPPKTS